MFFLCHVFVLCGKIANKDEHLVDTNLYFFTLLV